MFDDKEPTSEMQTRVLIAFALSALVLLFFAPKPGAKKDTPKTSAPVTQSQSAPAPLAPISPAAPPLKTPAQTETVAAGTTTNTILKEANETETVVESDLYEIHFSNRGGVATSWILRNFKDANGKPLDVVNPLETSSVGWPMSIYADDSGVRNALAQGLFVVKATSRQAPATVSFDFSDGSITSHKEFHFEPDSYVVHITSDLKRDGRPLAHEVSWRGGFGDRTVPKYNLSSVYTLAVGDKTDHKTIKEIKSDMRPAGPFHFISIEDLFFAAVFMPGGEGDTAAASVPTAAIFKDNYAASAGDPLELAGLTVGGDSTNRLRAYIGPKDLGRLQKISPDPRGNAQTTNIAGVIDFGWFGIVGVPLFMGLKWIYAHLVPNYGWAIIILTIGINFVLFPLKLSSMKSSMKMQKLAPQVKEINDRYKKYKMNDPKKAEANELVMALYKKEGVNPLGGCLPLAIQLPFLYGFYRVLSQVIEMRQAPWIFWVTDLSRAEAYWFHVLPVLMIISMVYLQRLTPQAPGGDPVQQKMMMFMPIMMGVMFYNVSSGLVLYWLTGNLVQIGQQLFINKTSPV